MSIRLFITGTDTGIGKSYTTVALLKAFRQRGLATIGIKPLATGGVWWNQQLYNDDALLLLANASIKLDYSKINPFIFEPAIAPHIAAQQSQRPFTAAQLLAACSDALNYPADICLIEGVGGWHTPLNDQETMADFVKIADCQVLLVVGMRLGCLNHTLLTAAAIREAQTPLLGWIANCLDPNMLYLEENIATLQQRLTAPYLGLIPYGVLNG